MMDDNKCTDAIKRAQVRRLFKRDYKNFIKATDLSECNKLFKGLKAKYEELLSLNVNIVDWFLKDDKNADLADEYDETEEYNIQFRECEEILERRNKKSTEKSTKILPRLEFEVFNLNERNWINFWAQFKNVHESVDIPKEDKLLYLLKTLEKGSKARLLVETYPISSENYDIVIDNLESRFGRKDLIIELYTRDLLELVLNTTKKEPLRDIFDKINTRLRGLESLGLTSSHYSAMLYPLVETALPLEIIKLWERCRSGRNMGSYAGSNILKTPLDELMEFLEVEVQGEERVILATEFRGAARDTSPLWREKTSSSLFNQGDIVCIFCGKRDHSYGNCFSAKKLSIEEKVQAAMKANVCLRCLEVGHRARFCRARLNCENCNKGHVTIMCDPRRNSVKNDKDDSKVVANLGVSMENEVILQTLRAKIIGEKGSKIVRILFDSGCQRSYCTNNMSIEVGLKKVGTRKMTHQLFGGFVGDIENLNLYQCRIESLIGNSFMQLTLLGKQSLCKNVSRLNKAEFETLMGNNIELTDIGEGCPDIDVVIGAIDMAHMLTGKMRHYGSVVVMETTLGWLPMGKVPRPKENIASLCLNACSDFWSLETLGIEEPMGAERKLDENYNILKDFTKTLRKDEAGRYIVRLPLKKDAVLPANNKVQARVRAGNVRKRLERNNQREIYDQVFFNWLHEGIIEKVAESREPERVFYLPHRPVFKDSRTTSCRPVFDGGAKGPNGVALNDVLSTGPNMVLKIPTVLTKFRMGKIGISSDIRAAFLMISVDAEDRDLIRFLWYNEEGKEQIFRHCRVVFGLTSSSFHLQATLMNILSNSRLEETAAKLKDSFYCDNSVTSVDSVAQYERFKREATAILEEGKFELRGWVTSYNVLENEECVEPVLGLKWNRKKDVLYINIGEVKVEENPTKRQLWSLVQKVFDPIGVTAPVQLTARLLLKEACKEDLKWDEALPPEIGSKLKTWVTVFPLLQVIEVKRYFGKEINEKATLHVFNDASQYAFATCCFLRLEDDSGVEVQLIGAKSRLTPDRASSIPRAELMAALLGARLSASIISALDRKIKVRYWSDSIVALYWIKTTGPWSMFVENRRKEITDLTDKENWNFVPGDMNPADLPSRGCDAQSLVKDRWWEGPNWLKDQPEKWPASNKIECTDEANRERKKHLVKENTSLAMMVKPNFFENYPSSYRTMVRVIAYIRRWLNLVRNRIRYNTIELTSEELITAEIRLIKIIQEESPTQKKELNLMKDEHDIVRVITKLNCDERNDESFCHPILISGDHPITKALIREKHETLCHANVRNLLSCLRKEFYIPKARQQAKKIIRKCVRCRRFSEKPVDVPMCKLPSERTHLGPCFDITGVDHFGPLNTKDIGKVWVVIYTCAVYRAIHLEAVDSLSTEAFMMSLRRFIARRGKPSKIYSDSGTAFIGADNIIKEAIIQFSAERGIKFLRGPPASPWWTGFIERMVGVVKNLLRKCLGNAFLNLSELSTLLCEVEDVCNNRPLTYNAEHEPAALTPNDFLLPGNKSETKDLDAADMLRERSHYLQNIRETLRTRFKEEYLSELICLGRRKPRELLPGDIVLVGSDDKKRVDWPMGLVLETFPGRDGAHRVARLRVNGKELTRAFQRLYPLEIHSELDEVDIPTILPEVGCNGDNVQGSSVIEDSSEEDRPEDLIERRTKTGRVVKAPQRLDL